MKKNDIDKIIHQAIKGNELPFNRFFEETFQKLYPKLKSLTSSQDDIKDMYVMSMQKFWQRFVVRKEEIPSNSVGYIYVMCKNAFLLKKRESWSSVILSDTPDKYHGNQTTETSEDVENDIHSKNELLKHKALAIALEELSPKCKTLMENELDKEIKLKYLMDELGYANYQALVQAKYNCKKRLIKKVSEVLSKLKTGKLIVK